MHYHVWGYLVIYAESYYSIFVFFVDPEIGTMHVSTIRTIQVTFHLIRTYRKLTQ